MVKTSLRVEKLKDEICDIVADSSMTKDQKQKELVYLLGYLEGLLENL